MNGVEQQLKIKIYLYFIVLMFYFIDFIHKSINIYSYY